MASLQLEYRMCVGVLCVYDCAYGWSEFSLRENALRRPVSSGFTRGRRDYLYDMEMWVSRDLVYGLPGWPAGCR